METLHIEPHLKGFDPMNIEILDTNFQQIFFVESYESFIWTERYTSAGEFELYLHMNASYLNYIRQDNYVTVDDSETVMIIETIEIITDFEDGDHLKVTGKSIESLLNRRIIWQQTKLVGRFDLQIKRLLNENIISPSSSLSNRKISNFVYKETADPHIIGLNISIQFTGDNLYDAISELCSLYNIGFKIVVNNGNFEFSLYSGQDRSDLVEFSTSFDNLISTNYFESIENEKNVALVAGEGEGPDRRTVVIGNTSGLERKEVYVDARDLQIEEGQTESEYNDLLRERGYEKLSEQIAVQSFDGSIDYNREFFYRKDYFQGDIVKIANDYGISANARITEIVRSMDENGYEIYPTFEVI